MKNSYRDALLEAVFFGEHGTRRYGNDPIGEPMPYDTHILHWLAIQDNYQVARLTYKSTAAAEARARTMSWNIKNRGYLNVHYAQRGSTVFLLKVGVANDG